MVRYNTFELCQFIFSPIWQRLFKFIFVTCGDEYPNCDGGCPDLSLSHVAEAIQNEVEAIQGKASAVVALLQLRWCLLEDSRSA